MDLPFPCATPSWLLEKTTLFLHRIAIKVDKLKIAINVSWGNGHDDDLDNMSKK